MLGLKPFRSEEIKIQAPKYFKENHKLVDEIDEKLAKSLNVTPHWFKAQSKKNNKEFNECIGEFADAQKFTEKDKEKLRWYITAQDKFLEYCWFKFRLDHMEDKFGMADHLEYDEDTNEITAKWFHQRVKRIAKKVKRKKNKKK